MPPEPRPSSAGLCPLGRWTTRPIPRSPETYGEDGCRCNEFSLLPSPPPSRLKGFSAVFRGRGARGEGAATGAAPVKPSPPTPLPLRRAGEGRVRAAPTLFPTGESQVSSVKVRTAHGDSSRRNRFGPPLSRTAIASGLENLRSRPILRPRPDLFRPPMTLSTGDAWEVGGRDKPGRGQRVGPARSGKSAPD
jgi:hypothetical protein